MFKNINIIYIFLMKICIVTCNIGNYDVIHKLDINQKDQFDWYYFTDKRIQNNWENILLSDVNFQLNDKNLLNSVNSENLYTKNRMKTKFIKIQTHNLEVIKNKNYDYIIWIDASFKISNNNFIDEIKNLINNQDIILFDHYHKENKNIKGEIQRCRSWKRKSCLNQKFDEQLKKYLNEGYQDNKLYCGGFFIRKNNDTVNKMFDEWYLHNQEFSYRDQTSLPYLIWKHKLNIKLINGYIDESPLIGKKITRKRNDNLLNVLNILIPATPRNEIHKNACINFIQIIKNSRKIKKLFGLINVIVNLDIPDFLNNDIEIKNCLENFKILNNDLVKIHFNKNNNPCFYEAWKYLFKKCKSIINVKDKNSFFWFEDDWAIDKNKKDMIIDNIINYHQNKKYQFMQFVNEIPSGPPFFFKLWYFNIVVDYINKNNKNIDPEDIMKELFKRNVWRRSKYRNKIKLLIVSKREDKLFYDIGIDWRDNQKIKKWNKENSNKKNWSI